MNFFKYVLEWVFLFYLHLKFRGLIFYVLNISLLYFN